jgi:pimeloyl-ACP methyl ester carboxylesterase
MATTATPRSGMTYTTLGSGPGLLVVGGALRSAVDYAPLGEALADRFTVHLIDRRGRGRSDPQPPDYGLDLETSDLLAVQRETGARFAFGHSFGGLVALAAARRTSMFERIAVYEPGVPTGPVPTEWMAPYEQRLDAGDEYGAFAHFIRGSGGAPRFVSRLPQWYLGAVLRLGFRGPGWQRMRPLLRASLAEHRVIAEQQGTLESYAAVTAEVLVLAGSRSTDRESYARLAAAMPHARRAILPGLDHFGPEGKSAAVVARAVTDFMP